MTKRTIVRENPDARVPTGERLGLDGYERTTVVMADGRDGKVARIASFDLVGTDGELVARLNVCPFATRPEGRRVNVDVIFGAGLHGARALHFGGSGRPASVAIPDDANLVAVEFTVRGAEAIEGGD